MRMFAATNLGEGFVLKLKGPTQFGERCRGFIRRGSMSMDHSDPLSTYEKEQPMDFAASRAGPCSVNNLSKWINACDTKEVMVPDL